MLYRKREVDIREWINNSDKALLVTGARQIGKTYIIREMLKKENVDYVEINLLDNPEYLNYLNTKKSLNSKEFIQSLSMATKKTLTPGKTIVFIDEVQEFKEIITLSKFLVLEGSYKYIFSGSLLGIELNNLRSAPVGFLRTIDMFPMDFEEFLKAFNVQDEIIHLLKESFDKRYPVDDFIHKKIMELFFQYIIIGGMPECVQTFINTNDYNKVLNVQSSIINQYKKDFTKYEELSKKLKLEKTYDLIPSELNSKNKRYTFSNLDKELKYNRYEESFEWLIHVGVSIPIYNVTEPRIPLRLNQKSNLFKLFLSDIGLLTSMYGKSTIFKILSEEKGINYGAMFENYVAQELTAHGYSGFYFNSKKQGELDFVIEYKNECLPIEVKSGKDYSVHSALNNVLSNQEYGIKEAFVLCNSNVKVVGNITYYPIYMTMFIDENSIELPKPESIDVDLLNKIASRL